MIATDDSIAAFLDKYILCRTLCPGYAAQIIHRCHRLDIWHGSPVRIRDLDDELISAWIADLQEEGRLAPKTIREYRAAILAVWNAAYEDRMIDHPPGRIRRVRVPRQPVEAWTLPEIRRLLDACRELPGKVPHTTIRRSIWFGRFIRLAYYSALRFSDLLALKAENIASNGLLRFVAHKTLQPVCVSLPRSCVAYLPKRGILLPWPGSKRQIFVWFKRLVAMAGIRPGTTRWLRRSAASYCEKCQPGSARRLLGHRSPGLAERHYLDRSICGQLPPRVPRI